MVAISGYTGSAPLVGSKVIWDRASGGSIWSEQGSSDPRSNVKSSANCVWSEAYWTPDGVKMKRHLNSLT